MIYLDTCMVIYAVEDDGPRGNAIRQRLASAGDEIIAISPLVQLECLVGPLRDDDLALHDHYHRAFELFQLLQVGQEHYLRAATLRATHGLRTPDALHLAVAQLHGCTELWTNDNRLASASKGLAIDALS